MDEKTLREKTNPVYETAKATLLNLAALENAQASEMARALGIDVKEVFEDPVQAQSLNPATQAFIEARYVSMNDLIDQSQAQTIIDLPCGYNPRALQIPKDKLNIGLDLPVVIEEIGPVYEKMGQGKAIGYYPGDPTNYASLKQALKDAQGPLAIATDGLLMLYSDGETREYLQNVARLLKEYGGALYTQDPLIALHQIDLFTRLLGDQALEFIRSENHTYSGKANLNTGQNTLTIKPYEPDGLEKARAFLEGNGLKMEEVPIGPYLGELKIYEQFEPEQVEAIKDFYDHASFWKLTPIEEEESGESDVLIEEEKFSFDFKVKKDDLDVRLAGRIDSLNAPVLLEAYQKVAPLFSEKVDVDASHLAYISSAGFRVLLIMVREGHEVHIHGANEEVKELFEQMGFDQILTIEP